MIYWLIAVDRIVIYHARPAKAWTHYHCKTETRYTRTTNMHSCWLTKGCWCKIIYVREKSWATTSYKSLLKYRKPLVVPTCPHIKYVKVIVVICSFPCRYHPLRDSLSIFFPHLKWYYPIEEVSWPISQPIINLRQSSSCMYPLVVIKSYRLRHFHKPIVAYFKFAALYLTVNRRDSFDKIPIASFFVLPKQLELEFVIKGWPIDNINIIKRACLCG
jgi:hypothetical protein